MSSLSELWRKEEVSSLNRPPFSGDHSVMPIFVKVCICVRVACYVLNRCVSVPEVTGGKERRP